MSTPLAVVIVEDEAPARRRLERLVAAQPGLWLAGSFAHPLEGRAAVAEADLLLLDIEMPFQNGFALLDTLAADRPRAVIVVTAHARHAVPAFGHEAADFLLKPFDEAGFEQAVQRARRRLQAARMLAAAGADPPPRAPAPLLRLRLPGPDGDELLEPAEVEWIGADDKTVQVHARGRCHRVSGSLADYEQRLAPHGFVRSHRSALVNLASIRALRPRGHGDALLVLASGAEVPLSRRYAGRVQSLIL
jgi:two-component system, LytTR family, response regulator